jgi:hypothetical protein
MRVGLQYKNFHINKDLNMLHIAICCILLLYSIDCIYFVFRLSLRYGFPATEYGDPNDLFADLFKIAFSFKGIIGDFFKSNAFLQFDDIYKTYPYTYKTLAEWTPEYHSISWFPPVFLFAPAIAAFLFTIGASSKLVILIYTLFLLLLALYTLYYCCKLGNIKFPFILSLVLIAVVMPTIYTILRGNFNAAYTCIGIIAFSIAISLENKFRFYPSFLLAMSIGARPTAVIFLILPMLLYGINRKTINIIVYTSILSVIVTLLCWLFLKYCACYNWNISDFFTTLKIHKDIFISKGLGNTHNLSLRGFIFDIFQNCSPRARSYIFYSCILILASIIFTITKIRKYDSDIYVFLLCSFYALYNESFFIYHNLIFLAPLYLYYIKKEHERVHDYFNFRLIVFVSIILLSPNSFVFNSPTILDRYLLIMSIIIFLIRSLINNVQYKSSLN